MNKEIYNTIKKYDKIVIFRHEYADPDALGSQFGLKQLILNNFTGKSVYAVGDNVKTLNGVLFPMMDECDDETIKESLVIILDTANTQRISDKRYDLGKEIIKIDHHPIIEQYGTYNYVDEKICATSFFIARLAYELELMISPATATYLYAGIVGDTGRFLHNNTTARVMDMASKLIHDKADIQAVYNAMYSRSIDEVRLTGFILDNFKMYSDHLAYYILEVADYEGIGVEFEKAKEYINTLANIDGVKIWVSATFNKKTNFYHISIRSKNIIINDVAQAFGGGGHQFASGVKTSSLERFKLILAALNEKI
ncbi:bifunctional oligoribonuclease/PAP phosphatase NrnA [Erysipelotrichaceae bacterium OttesenSCG-928-M19]|nr:bifunctional oligoribonuclease/PAP phosphatase NrnA [Erysipelotrichaceae bacterium OttesenSCG-928-M19]